MESIFLKLIDQLNSSVFVLLILIIFIILFTNRISLKIGEWKERYKNQDERIIKNENFYNEFISFKSKVKTKLDLIFENTRKNPSYEKMSPMKLTERGERIRADLNMDEILNKYFDDLCSLFSKEDYDTSYDIEQKCNRVCGEEMKNLISPIELKEIKEFSFKEGMLLDEIFMIFSILLRDKLLKK